MSGMNTAVLRLIAAALCLSIMGCSAGHPPERGKMIRKPRNIPEQKIPGGPGATAEYVTDCRREFQTCLREVFLEIAERSLAERRDIPPQVMDRAVACYDRFSQVIKGGTNLRRIDVEEALLEGEKRQRHLHHSLGQLADRFSSHGVRFQIAGAGHFDNKILWENGVEAGCGIQTDHDVDLFAYPLMSLTTREYMVPRAGPIAAELVFLDADMMLFSRHGEDPGEAFASAAREIFGDSRDISDEIEGVHLARLYDHHLEIITMRQWSGSELDSLRTAYGVLAVVRGDPHDFTAMISVGPEVDLPVLLREKGEW